jgi:hypothetical protein
MPIKYGELTIIYNKEQATAFTSFLIWLKYEERPPKKSKYVFLFDDGEICDSDDKLKDLKFIFFDNNSLLMPLYFEKNITCNKIYNKTYFYKNPIKDKNTNLSLNFTKLFSSYSKYSLDPHVGSIYNSIYYCCKDLLKPEIFGLLRIKSNEYMPRFLFAYDIDEFTKEEIVYLIYYIFNH